MTDYLVHSRHDTIVHVKAKTDSGHDVVGLMPGSVIELVPVDGAGPTLTLHEHAPTQEDLDKILATFPEGGTVRSLGFELVNAPKKKKKAEADEGTEQETPAQ